MIQIHVRSARKMIMRMCWCTAISASGIIIRIVLVYRKFLLWDTGSATTAERNATSILGTLAHPVALATEPGHHNEEQEVSSGGSGSRIKWLMPAGPVSGSLSGIASIWTSTFPTTKRQPLRPSGGIANVTTRIAANTRPGNYEDGSLNCRAVATAVSEIPKPVCWTMSRHRFIQLEVERLGQGIILAHLKKRRQRISKHGRLSSKLAKKSSILSRRPDQIAGRESLAPHQWKPKRMAPKELPRDRERCEGKR
jgi:hypothetical protein